MHVVFDLDGTLIDSAPDIQSVAAAVLQPLGKSPLTLEETRRFVGEGSAVFVSRMMAARDIDPEPGNHERLLADFLARYVNNVDKAEFYPGVVATLATLREAGHRLGLCTNKPEAPARAVLEHMGLEGVFDAVIAGGMLDSRKPDPGMLLRVIDDLGGGPTLYVGDSEIDAATAERAEVPFALFTQGYRRTPVNELKHDWAFADFSLLPGIVATAARQSVCA